jgi:hypothetical protein
VHFLTCSALGANLQPALETAVAADDWEQFVLIVFCRFQVFLHYFRGGEFEQDELDLFTALTKDREE